VPIGFLVLDISRQKVAKFGIESLEPPSLSLSLSLSLDHDLNPKPQTQEDAKLGIKRHNPVAAEAKKMANFSMLTRSISTKMEESQEARAARLKEEKEKRRAERRLKRSQSAGGESFSRAGSAESEVSVKPDTQT
jgi:hypothetical protein